MRLIARAPPTRNRNTSRLPAAALAIEHVTSIGRDVGLQFGARQLSQPSKTEFRRRTDGTGRCSCRRQQPHESAAKRARRQPVLQRRRARANARLLEGDGSSASAGVRKKRCAPRRCRAAATFGNPARDSARAAGERSAACSGAGRSRSMSCLDDRRRSCRTSFRRRTATRRQHLVEHDTERPDVRALVDGLALRLLWRHVGGSAKDDAHLRHRRRGEGRESSTSAHCASPVAAGAVHRLGESEIQHLHRAVIADLDVGRLEIAMNDPVLVRRFERVGDLPGDRQRFFNRQSGRAQCAATGPRRRRAP